MTLEEAERRLDELGKAITALQQELKRVKVLAVPYDPDVQAAILKHKGSEDA